MSYDSNNIFARILRKELPCRSVFENEFALAFHDLFPAAPTHVLVIPKGEFISFDDFMQSASPEMVMGFFQAVQMVANQLDLVESGYRLISNHGADAAQTVPHFHVHILGKKKLGPLI